jgi:two-component system chemotaxis response regulator CheY
VPATHRHHILIVEDNVDTRQALELVLELEGYSVQGAGDGAEALIYARSPPRPCLILLDVNMPRMDGSAFRREQIADPRIREIPVVVLSALPRHHPMLGPLADVEMCQKPIDAGKLVALVERYCGHSATHYAIA